MKQLPFKYYPSHENKYDFLLAKKINERKYFMQETQHTQQTATRTAHNQGMKQRKCKQLQNHRGQTEININ